MAIQPIRIVIQGIDQFSSTIAQSQKKIENFGKGLSQVGKKMSVGLTLPIVAFGTSTIKTAADFEKAMNRVQVLTRASEDQFNSLRNQAKDLGRTTVFSAVQAGEAMSYLAMAGFSTDKIIGAMPGTLALAAAGQMEIARTADIASNILSAFRLDASEMNRVADVLAYTMSNANTNLEQLGEAMKFVAPVAAGMNIPIEEVAAAIGKLSDNGIQGAMAGTNLRMILAQLASPTKELRRVFSTLKIPKDEIIDATGNVRGFTRVIEALEKSGATTEQVLSAFGSRAGPAVLNLMGSTSQAMSKMTKDLQSSAGTAETIAKKQTEGWAGQMLLMKSAIEALQNEIAEAGVLEFLTELLSKLTDFIAQLSELNPEILKWGAIIAGVIAAIGPLLMILGPIITGIAALSGWIASAGGVVALLSNPIGWVIAAIVALIAIVIAMKAKFGMSIKSIGAALLTLLGPIGWVIAIFIKNWNKVLPFLKLIGLGFKALGSLILYILWPVFKVLELFGDLLGWVTGKILDMLSFLARLVLPKWLEEKIGLTPAENSQNSEAQNLAGRAGVINRNENETKITIEDRAGVKLRTETKQGTIDTEVLRGLGFQGAM